jgi:hypothetical protein
MNKAEAMKRLQNMPSLCETDMQMGSPEWNERAALVDVVVLATQDLDYIARRDSVIDAAAKRATQICMGYEVGGPVWSLEFTSTVNRMMAV